MALPKIEPLGTEFDMPQGGGDAVREEITKLGAVIIDQTSVGVKAATKAVIGDVPKMIQDLTNEIESGPIDNFAMAMNKLISLVDKLGINLRDYNNKLADTVDEFKGTQQQVNEKLLEFRKNGIKAEYDQKTGAIKFLTQEEINIRKENIEKNEKQIRDKQAEIAKLTSKLGTDEFIGQTKTGKDRQLKTETGQENYLKKISDEIEKLNEDNERDRESIKDVSADTGRDTGGFSQLSQIKEAFMVIPDTIADVATSFANVGKSVFGFIKMFKQPMKAFKEIGKSLGAIGNIFKIARIMIALKVMAVVMAFQFFAEKIDKIGAFFVGIWEKITGFFQDIVDWFTNSAFGKLLGLGGKDEPKEKTEVADKNAGTAGDIAGEASFADFDDGNAPVRNMSSARLEDGLENQTVDPTLSDYDDNSAKIIAQRQIAGMDGEGTEEIDYTGMRGGTSLSQLGIKKRQVVGDQFQTDDTMYGGVSESLKELNTENAAVSSQPVLIQNNSSVSSQSSSGTTVSGFVDHEPDTSYKYIRSGASGSDEF